jgi:hypothetical protein
MAAIGLWAVAVIIKVISRIRGSYGTQLIQDRERGFVDDNQDDEKDGWTKWVREARGRQGQ